MKQRLEVEREREGDNRETKTTDSWRIRGLERGGEVVGDSPITAALVFPSIQNRRKLTSLKRNPNPGLRERERKEGHLTDICDDIREDCLTIRKGGCVCVCSLAKCIESSFLEWIFIRTSSEPTRTRSGIQGILACWHAAMSIGRFFFSFFFFKRKRRILFLLARKMVFGLETTVCSFEKLY